MKRLVSAILILAITISAMWCPSIGYSAPVYYEDTGLTFDTETGTITACDPTVAGAFTIPSTIDGVAVTTIGYNAFKDCSGITSLYIPDTVTTISRSAFYNCDGLTEITIPNSVVSAPSYNYAAGRWFDGCDNLTTVTFESGTTTILPSCLAGSPALTNVNIPDTVTSIGIEAFDGCGKLAIKTLPNSVTYIDAYAFRGCHGLTDFTIPNSVTTISRQAFLECDGLTEMFIPNSVVSAPSYNWAAGRWFDGCDNLKTVTFESGTTTILPSCLAGSPALTNVNIPDTVTSIGMEAFDGCGKLAIKTLPNSVTYIDAYAFSDCHSLTNFTIPNSVTTISRQAFDNCDGLTEMFIPNSVVSAPSYNYGAGRWFADCDSLKTVTFESGTTTILPSCLAGSPALTNVNIPGTVTSIGKEAFDGCSKLAIKTLPDSITHIGAYSFRDCKSLKEFTIPGSVVSIGRNVFYNCDGLTEMFIPKSIVDVPTTSRVRGRWFVGCDNLVAIEFEEGTEVILSEIICDTPNLEIIRTPDSVKTVEKGAFSDLSKAVVYGAESAGIVGAIDHNLQFVITKEITNYDHFEYSSTDFYTTTDTILGYLPFNFEYKVKPGKELTEMEMVTKVPSGTVLIENTIKYNDHVITDYTYNKSTSILTIPLTERQGKVSFSIRPSSYDMLPVYAKVNFTEDDVRDSETIGIINCSMPSLSIAVPEKTNSADMTIKGMTNPSTNVDLYVGDSLIGSTTSLKTGSYSFDVTLPDVQNYHTYDITAKATTSKGKESISSTVQYDAATPEVTSLVMEYKDHSKRYAVDLVGNEVPPTVVFNPNLDLTFKVKFDDNDDVDNVAIVSNKRGNKTYIDANWDEAEQAYVAKGNFGVNNANSDPGAISVKYTRKVPEIPIGDTVDVEMIKELMDPRMKGNTVQVVEDTENLYHETITIADDLKGELFDELDHIITTSDVDYSQEDMKNRNTDDENFFSYVFEDAGIIFDLDMTDSTALKFVVHDMSNNKKSEHVLNGIKIEQDGTRKKLNINTDCAEDVFETAGFVMDGLEIFYDDASLKKDIMSSNMTLSQKMEALDKADELRSDRTAFLVATMVIGAATASAVGPSALIFSLLFAAVTESSGFFWDKRMGNIMNSSAEFSCRWIIDPSGYVYEGVTSNRLEGVTTTAYWVAPDEEGNYDKANAMEWNATEYEQINPLITDSEGRYAWNVPEGLWQVKFEKEGYETQYSDWLPVPPPQTEVHAGLVSYAVPNVTSTILTPDTLTVTFDKYMVPDSVKISVDGKSYTPTYSKEGKDLKGNIFVNTFTCKLDASVKVGDTVSVQVTGGKSYANVDMVTFSKNVDCIDLANSIIISGEAKDGKDVTADFTNTLNSSFVAICAAYEGNNLAEVKFITIKDSAQTCTFEFEGEWSKFKLFAWDSMEGQNNLSNVKEINE